MSVSVTFLGASGTVTGSKYLVSTNKESVMIDAGLFQGSRAWREKNWDKLDFDVDEIDAVLLTHAHIDHTGYLPRLYSQGLKCPTYASESTVDLAKILLPDSAYLQEEEARYRNKEGLSRHKPALPLYTVSDAQQAISHLKSVPVHERIEVLPGVFATWNRMGHIIGACSITLEIGGKRIIFSGDIGRYSIPILKDPEPLELGDLLLIESTYGARNHEDKDPAAHLGRIINETSKRGGATIIPSFAVGRAQLLLYYIRQLKDEKKIPDVPVIVDSPMATEATNIYKAHPKDYDEEALGLLKSGNKPFSPSKLHFTRSREESKALNSVSEPMIIISASGMLTGGRILHHLFHRISSPLNSLVFVGYQPDAGRGAWILSGAKTLKLLGRDRPIKAQIHEISGLSAHADSSELLRWAKSCTGTPGLVAMVHGEEDGLKGLQKTLKDKLSWNTIIPVYRQTIEL